VTERREWAAIIGITTLAVIGRLMLLWEPMRFDEAVSWAYYVGRSWGTIVGTYQQPNNHVFYSLLAKISAAGAGYPPWALRLPALLAGVAIVPLIWAVGRRFADNTTAMLAAGLAVGSTQLMLYSINARGYSLVVALFLVMLLVADRLRDESTNARWAAFIALGAIGFYTIPIMLYPLGVVTTWLALSSRALDRPARKPFLIRLVAAFVIAIGIAGLLYLPIIMTAGLDALLGNKFVSPSPWDVFLMELPSNFGGTLGRWTSPFPWWATPVLTILALLGMLRPKLSERPSLVLAAFLWCTALLFATHRAPFFRVWLFLLPLFLLSVARGITWCVRRALKREMWRSEWPPIAFAAATLALAIATHSVAENDDTGAFRPAKQMTAVLAPLLRAGDRVLAPIPSIGPMLYYFPHAGADTTLLTIPIQRASRAYIVLDPRSGQSLEWAVRAGMINPNEFPEPKLLAKYPDGELWEVSRGK
jgi:4-amino-4-deoxy-L-arabinose transferase-like glycosyltransferase